MSGVSLYERRLRGTHTLNVKCSRPFGLRSQEHPPGTEGGLAGQGRADGCVPSACRAGPAQEEPRAGPSGGGPGPSVLGQVGRESHRRSRRFCSQSQAWLHPQHPARPSPPWGHRRHSCCPAGQLCRLRGCRVEQSGPPLLLPRHQVGPL